MNQRLQNDALARLLHSQLYDRMIKFCEQYTPEIPAEPIVTTWLSRLFQGDSNLHILVTLDNSYQVKGHAVVDVQQAYGFTVVQCYQAHADKGYTSTLDEGIEYVEKLADFVGAKCSLFSVTRHMKGLEKRYGYKVVRTTMMKCYGGVSDNGN